jgi:hypothetical protein
MDERLTAVREHALLKEIEMQAFQKAATIGALVLCTVMFLSLPVNASDLNDRVTRIENDLVQLKTELRQLQSLVRDLTATVKSQGALIAGASGKPTIKPSVMGLSKPEIRSVVCKAVDAYIREINECLRLSDGVEAQNRMQRAYSALASSINRYSNFPDVARIVNIAQDLDYDTASDVSLKESVEGTSAFVKSIRNHKEKLEVFCRKQ